MLLYEVSSSLQQQRKAGFKLTPDILAENSKVILHVRGFSLHVVFHERRAVAAARSP